MRLLKLRNVIASTLGATCVLGWAGAAHATNCSSLPNVVYGAGGSAQQPFIAQVGAQLSQLATPITLVYSDSASACTGYQDLVSSTLVTGTANYFDATGAVLQCDLTTSSVLGEPVTFAVMGNAPNLCSGDTGLAPGFGQFLGAVQPVDFVVPFQSTQQSISTEAAYFIWGFGASDAAHSVTPWTASADIFTRSLSSFVNVFVALDTGVPAATVAAHGTVESTNSATVSALAALNGTASAGEGIGFVSGEVADGNRSSIKILAYQHTGQTCGYWPDSTPTAFDKQNVRTSQYWLWSPIHFYAAIGDSGGIADPATAALIGYLDESVAAPAGFDLFNAEIASYTVPKCAMQAWRDGDLAEPYSYQPPASCSCKYDFATASATKPASCKTCTQNSDCSTNFCRNIGTTDAGATVGYCEVN